MLKIHMYVVIEAGGSIFVGEGLPMEPKYSIVVHTERVLTSAVLSLGKTSVRLEI